MKFSRGLFWTLILITVIAQFGSSKIIAKRENKEIITKNGTDISLTEPGILDVIVGDELIFEICTMNCAADFLVCYEGDPPGQEVTALIAKSCGTQCGFYVSGDEKVTKRNDSICYMNSPSLMFKNETCDVAKMKFKKFRVRFGYHQGIFSSCNPKIENGMIQLNITKASPECPITVKNAKFVPIEVSTTDSSSNENPSKNSNPESTPSDNNSATAKIIEIYFGFILVLFSIFILQ